VIERMVLRPPSGGEFVGNVCFLDFFQNKLHHQMICVLTSVVLCAHFDGVSMVDVKDDMVLWSVEVLSFASVALEQS